MSGYTGTWKELLYQSGAGLGTPKNTFLAEVQINDTAGMPGQPYIPKGFWLPGGPANRGIGIKAMGVVSSTGTPTFTLLCRLGTQGSTTAAAILQSAAMTTVTGAAGGAWEFEGEFFLTSLGASGAASSGRGQGWLKCGANAFASPFNYPLYGGGSSPGSLSNLDTTIDNFVNFNSICSVSNLANQIQLQHLEVWGLN
jgi:hypothetical protein